MPQKLQAALHDLPGGMGLGQARARNLHLPEAFRLRQKLFYPINQNLSCKMFI